MLQVKPKYLLRLQEAEEGSFLRAVLFYGSKLEHAARLPFRPLWLLILLNTSHLGCPADAALLTEGGLFFIMIFTEQLARR